VKPIPILVTVGSLLAVGAIVVATIFDGDSEQESVGGLVTPSPTPFCTTLPGEPGVICPDVQEPVCLPTTDHISFINELVLPRTLPPELAFSEGCAVACVPGAPCNQSAEIKYESADGGAHFQVSTATGFAVEPRERETLQLGPIPGYIIRNQGIYGVEFELRGRAYTVIAVLGPENRLTEADLNAVAQDMASQG
jgi:hypothetical protein